MEVESQINKNFNSTMVRLREQREEMISEMLENFNSTMVRLREEEEPENAVKDSEFQFHDGPIERVVP